MASVVLPFGISFKDWSDQVRQDFSDIEFPIVESEDEWWDWASQLINTNNLPLLPLPTLIAFPNKNDWGKWASYFAENMYNLNN